MKQRRRKIKVIRYVNKKQFSDDLTIENAMPAIYDFKISKVHDKKVIITIEEI